MKIVLGSESPYKITALLTACKRLGLPMKTTCMKTVSGQNEQPVGFDETYQGALTRAQQVKKQHSRCTAIGIESGIFTFGEKNAHTFDIAIIVILTEDNREIAITSEGIQFPKKYVQTARERSFRTTTVGSVISEALGGDSGDPHSVLTKGKTGRMSILANALELALKQM